MRRTSTEGQNNLGLGLGFQITDIHSCRLGFIKWDHLLKARRVSGECGEAWSPRGVLGGP